MEYKIRYSVEDSLQKYTFSDNEDAYIAVTEWSNGEGFDIDINGRMIVLSREELDAINYLAKAIDISKDEDYKNKKR